VRGVDLTSETSGEITAINFDSGREVEAGQLLLVLNDKIEQASRQNDIATLELANILFERDRRLVTQKSIPQSQYDQSKADLSRARAQLAETEARLKNKRIHAPFRGTLGIRRVDMGDYIEPGTVIATLQDKSELEIDFTLPARFAPRLRPGLKISLTVGAFPEQIFHAELVALDARVDPDTRNLLLRARLLEGDGLLPGMFATLRIDLDRSKAFVTVPETSVSYSLQGNVVHVIEATDEGDLTAVSRIVTVGEVRAGRTAILDGLAADERIVTVGQNKLYRGVKVIIDENVAL
jgi:membrane fusion protein (multidrug efflux system)